MSGRVAASALLNTKLNVWRKPKQYNYLTNIYIYIQQYIYIYINTTTIILTTTTFIKKKYNTITQCFS